MLLLPCIRVFIGSRTNKMHTCLHGTSLSRSSYVANMSWTVFYLLRVDLIYLFFFFLACIWTVAYCLFLCRTSTFGGLSRHVQLFSVVLFGVPRTIRLHWAPVFTTKICSVVENAFRPFVNLCKRYNAQCLMLKTCRWALVLGQKKKNLTKNNWLNYRQFFSKLMI